MGHVLKASQVSTLMTKRLLQNLEIESNASNPTYQVDINSGLVGSDDGTVVMEVSSPITVDITASGVNGLDTGSEADNTWYYIWLIYNPSTDTVAGLFSTSNSSPTMPSGYTKKRLIGAVRNAFGSDFCEFYQHGEEVFYRYDIQVLAAGSATSQTGIDCSNFVPSIASLVKLYAYCWVAARFIRISGGLLVSTISVLIRRSQLHALIFLFGICQ